MTRFLEALHSGQVLLMDGAMGTELQRAGMAEGECYELWNLTQPEKVRKIHQSYQAAGATVFLTNTFQANPTALAKHRLNCAQGSEIIQAGAHLARSVAGTGFVLLDVGPAPQVPALQQPARQLPVDVLLLETASDVDELGLLLNDPLPVLFSWTFTRAADGSPRTITGRTPESCAQEASRFDIAALGVNCGRDIGMAEIIDIVRRYRSLTSLPLFARPNAGTPTRQGDRWVYPLTPVRMAELLPELLEAGVSMVGGCCGTTPDHIAAMKSVVDAWNARRKNKQSAGEG